MIILKIFLQILGVLAIIGISTIALHLLLCAIATLYFYIKEKKDD